VAYELTAAESVAEGFARTSREQLNSAVRAMSEELDDDPVGTIHTARKAIKKQRALLRLVRGSLPAKQRRDANDRLRTAARRLSGARDAEVMIQSVHALAERFAGQLPESTFTAVRERLEAERDSRDAAAMRAEVDAAVRDLDAVRKDAQRWKLRAGDWRAIEAGVIRSYRDGRRAFRRAQKKPALETRHAWRKRAKDSWYALRLLAPVCGPTVRGQAEEADHLAELLGAEHDFGVLKAKLRQIAPELVVDTDALIGLAELRRDQLTAQAAALAERMYAEKPSAFARRLRRCWKAGRAEHRAFEERHPAAPAAVTRAAR
jgi:CHAD domain-containing protein